MATQTDMFGRALCDAGRDADFGGRWVRPCPRMATDTLGAPDLPQPMHFCHEHMHQLIDAGLVTEPGLSEEEFERRRKTVNYYGEDAETLAKAQRLWRRMGRG